MKIPSHSKSGGAIAVDVPNIPQGGLELPRRGLLASLAEFLVLVLFLGLAGFLGWQGHLHHWKFPVGIWSGAVPENPGQWCGDHSVPESECIECNEELFPKGKDFGWCKIHGIPQCSLCNPEVAQLGTTPKLTPSDKERSLRSLNFQERPANNPICKTHKRRIQFASIQDVDKAGIDVAPVWTAPALESIAVAGELGFDQTGVAHLSSRAQGTVWRVFRHLGDWVTAGEVLALVDAADVGKAKSELLQAFAQLDLMNQTLASARGSAGTIADLKIREAESAVQAARIRLDAARQSLVNLGLTIHEKDLKNTTPEKLQATLQFLSLAPDLATKLDPQTTTTNLMPIVSPISGVVSSREVVAGEVVDTNRILFEVVESRKLWLTIDVRGEDARWLKMGQEVRFRPDGSAGELSAKINWISTKLDPKTRTIKGRADVSNPNGDLKGNTFGSGRVILREEAEVVSVPNDAVQWEGCCHVVFVRDKNYLKEGSPKVFHVRKVRIGAKDDKWTEIPAGVLPGEIVVTKGSGLLLTELLRGNLGEGCACHSKK